MMKIFKLINSMLFHKRFLPVVMVSVIPYPKPVPRVSIWIYRECHSRVYMRGAIEAARHTYIFRGGKEYWEMTSKHREMAVKTREIPGIFLV